MYNPVPDIIIMSALITILVAFINLMSYKEKGATSAREDDVLRHQYKRRMWMAANGGPKRETNTAFRIKYTVSGNGVAHRPASNYMKDPSVRRQMETK